MAPEKEINVSMASSIAGGGVVEHKKMLVKNTGEFPSLFRSVIEKLGIHGTATFFVPPEWHMAMKDYFHLFLLVLA